MLLFGVFVSEYQIVASHIIDEEREIDIQVGTVLTLLDQEYLEVDSLVSDFIPNEIVLDLLLVILPIDHFETLYTFAQ